MKSPIGKGGRPGPASGEISGSRPGLSATEPLKSLGCGTWRRAYPRYEIGVGEKVGVGRKNPVLRRLVHP